MKYNISNSILSFINDLLVGNISYIVDFVGVDRSAGVRLYFNHIHKL